MPDHYGCKTTKDDSDAQANAVAKKIRSSQGGTNTEKASLPKAPKAEASLKKGSSY